MGMRRSPSTTFNHDQVNALNQGLTYADGLDPTHNFHKWRLKRIALNIGFSTAKFIG